MDTTSKGFLPTRSLNDDTNGIVKVEKMALMIVW